LSIAAFGCGLALLVGCGGGEKHPTKADFVAKANAICATGNKQIDADLKAVGDNPSEQEMQDAIKTKLIPNVESQLDDIRDLGSPKGDEDKVKAIVDNAQSAADKVKEDPSLLTQEGADPFEEANRLAGDYGLSECAAS
jgi:hypothetical protein